jgi:hypothetical protein
MLLSDAYAYLHNCVDDRLCIKLVCMITCSRFVNECVNQHLSSFINFVECIELDCFHAEPRVVFFLLYSAIIQHIQEMSLDWR